MLPAGIAGWVKAGKSVTWITQKAVELLGPLGYSTEYLVEKWMRDGKINYLSVSGVLDQIGERGRPPSISNWQLPAVHCVARSAAARRLRHWDCCRQ